MNDIRKYFIRAYGTEEVKDYPPTSLKDAQAEMERKYEKCAAEHPWCEDMLELNDLDAYVAGEEFYQSWQILQVNASVGVPYWAEELRRTLDETDTAATCYQYELQECGVFDFTSAAKERLDDLLLNMENQLRALLVANEGDLEHTGSIYDTGYAEGYHDAIVAAMKELGIETGEEFYKTE